MSFTKSQSAPVPRPTALITGASSGIGLDLAWVLAEHGHDLVLVARTEAALEALAAELTERFKITAHPVPLDLRDLDAPRTLYDSLTARGILVDVLINNAGFGVAGRFDRTDLRTELDMLQVNVAALTELTKHFLPGMIERQRGRIVNVSSTAAFQPGPLMAVYYASKAYVLSFTEAIAEEMRNTGVTITALCPGLTRTNFAQAAGISNSKLFNSPLMMDSREVAEYGYDAMMRGKRVAIPGWFNQLVAFSNRLAPRQLATRLSRLAQENR